jgi:hypothetical protein
VIAIAIGVLSILMSRRQVPQPKALPWLTLGAALILLAAVVWTNMRCGLLFAWISWIPALLFLLAPGLLFLQDRISSPKNQPGLRTGLGIDAWRKLLWVAAAIHILASLVFLVSYPGNFNDVYTFQRDCNQALLHGVNPYTVSHANLYNAAEAARIYAPGIVWGGRVHAGYSYPPAALLFTIPGYLLGDVRYAQVLAVILSALLLVRIQANWAAIGAACVLLLSPISFWMEMGSWIEPFVLLALTLTVYAAVRRRWWLPLALGVFLVSKQFAVVAIPFVFFLQSLGLKQNLKCIGKTAAVAIFITAPLALWNLRSFIEDTVLLILRIPPRAGSLSLDAFMHIPAPVMYGAVVCAIIFCLLAAARTPAMFAAGFAFVLLIWMFLNKQAFSNYYFLIAHAFWLSAASPLSTPESS